ncbi:hypothetical protein IWZ03DRAFT_36012 [Phyllosticta citriasiana]|uniref:Uncharacterized protein n=1 Tax=Phyllosticta citriasiana TaxID=595635 RepID=A0ABR1L1K0_9PEZI
MAAFFALSGAMAVFFSLSLSVSTGRQASSTLAFMSCFSRSDGFRVLHNSRRIHAYSTDGTGQGPPAGSSRCSPCFRKCLRDSGVLVGSAGCLGQKRRKGKGIMADWAVGETGLDWDWSPFFVSLVEGYLGAICLLTLFACLCLMSFLDLRFGSWYR